MTASNAMRKRLFAFFFFLYTVVVAHLVVFFFLIRRTEKNIDTGTSHMTVDIWLLSSKLLQEAWRVIFSITWLSERWVTRSS